MKDQENPDEGSTLTGQEAPPLEVPKETPPPPEPPEPPKPAPAGVAEKDEIRQTYLDLCAELDQLEKDQDWIRQMNTHPRMIQIMERFKKRTGELKDHIAHFAKTTEIKGLRTELQEREGFENTISGMDMTKDVEAKMAQIHDFEEANELFINDLIKKRKKARAKK